MFYIALEFAQDEEELPAEVSEIHIYMPKHSLLKNLI